MDQGGRKCRREGSYERCGVNVCKQSDALENSLTINALKTGGTQSTIFGRHETRTQSKRARAWSRALSWLGSCPSSSDSRRLPRNQRASEGRACAAPVDPMSRWPVICECPLISAAATCGDSTSPPRCKPRRTRHALPFSHKSRPPSLSQAESIVACEHALLRWSRVPSPLPVSTIFPKRASRSGRHRIGGAPAHPAN